MALPLDQALIDKAAKALLTIPRNPDNHTVASAVRARSGLVCTGINIYHFTGGPCAELVALGVAVNGGVLATDLTTIVAVKKDADTGEVKVINPCGRCRQVLYDYHADIKVIVSDGEKNVTVTMREVLPYAPYVWGEGMEQR